MLTTRDGRAVPERPRRSRRRPALGLLGAVRRTPSTASARRSAREPAIASIGIDSWAVDYGLLADGRLLGEPFHYRDERTARGVDGGARRMPHRRALPPQRPAVPAVQHAVPVRGRAEPELLAIRRRGAAHPRPRRRTGSPAPRVAERRTPRPPDSRRRATGDVGRRTASPRSGCRAASCLRSSHPASASARCCRRSPRRSRRQPLDGRPAVGSHDTASAVVAVPMQRAMPPPTSPAAPGDSSAWRLDAPVLTPTTPARRTSRTRAASTAGCASSTTSWGCGC